MKLSSHHTRSIAERYHQQAMQLSWLTRAALLGPICHLLTLRSCSFWLSACFCCFVRLRPLLVPSTLTFLPSVPYQPRYSTALQFTFQSMTYFAQSSCYPFFVDLRSSGVRARPACWLHLLALRLALCPLLPMMLRTKP